MRIRDNRLVDKQPTSLEASARWGRTDLSAADGFTSRTNTLDNLIPSIVKGDCRNRGFGRTSTTDPPEVPCDGSREQSHIYLITERRRRSSHAASCGASAPCFSEHVWTIYINR